MASAFVWGLGLIAVVLVWETLFRSQKDHPNILEEQGQGKHT